MSLWNSVYLTPLSGLQLGTYNRDLPMTALRRHLASLGLAVATCHLVIQILVPVALCCQKPDLAPRAAARDCCPAGAHAGGICPMHASKRAEQPNPENDCQARPLVDLHDLFMALTSGGVVTSLVPLAAPVGSEAAPMTVEPAATPVASVPPGPPPRA
jgi:hypothetical protein